MPQISVVIAAHNADKDIVHCLESVSRQSFQDFEIIVVDDGSTDQTYAVLEAYREREPRLIIMRNDRNMGLAASLNSGIAAANSDLILRADADDINLPERFAEQYRFMLEHPDVDVLGSAAFLDRGVGTEMPVARLPLTHEEIVAQSFLKSMFFHPSVIIRRRFFDKAGFYDPKFLRAQDKELWIRGASAGCIYANLPSPLIRYHMPDSRRTWKQIERELKFLFAIGRRHNPSAWKSLLVLHAVRVVAVKLGLYVPRSQRSSTAA
ncbi:MAG TPA: glycosyltransferase [Ensifer sp.]|nr:glycosyltransferase [Ensifer sp.]